MEPFAWRGLESCMLFAALAVDYDGTLAQHGLVADEAVEAIKVVKDRGTKLILVAGRG